MPKGFTEMELRRFTCADFALMQRWLAQPHVLRWWAHETSQTCAGAWTQRRSARR